VRGVLWPVLARLGVGFRVLHGFASATSVWHASNNGYDDRPLMALYIGDWHPRDASTWRAWRSFLAALFALPMSAEQLALYQEFTGREASPAKEANEAYLICGRRAGKSAILAVTATYLAFARDYRPYLAGGEMATIRLMAADRDQTRSIFWTLKSCAPCVQAC
jgi:hypothetical protein